MNVQINIRDWAASAELAAIRAAAQNPRLNATVFLPGPQAGFTREASDQCLSLQDWLAEVMTDPKMFVKYLRTSFVLDDVVDSSQFYDGLSLQTSSRLVLGRAEM